MTESARRILITGAGTGIGSALAIEAAHRGMRVAICGRREQPLSDTYANLAGEGHLAFTCDVSDAADRARLIALLGEQWGALDTLINNAGVISFGPVRTIDDDEIDRLFATNLTAPIRLVRDCLPLLNNGVVPQIANMGSLLGSIPYPLFAAYSATKSGLHAFSTALRRELKPLGIAVTHVAPRGTKTAAATKLEAYANFLEMSFDAPDAVARVVLDGLAHRKQEIYPTGMERLFLAAQTVTPGLVDQAIARQLKRAAADGLVIH